MVRFGISALSRKNKSNALPTEIMIHKKTGQICIKTTDGDTISYDSSTRLKNHIDVLSGLAVESNVFGSIHSITFDEIELPELIEYNQNLLSEPLLIKNGNWKKIIVSLDLDSIEVGPQNYLVENEPVINLTLRFKHLADEFFVNWSDNLSSFNRKIIEPDQNFPSLDITAYDVYISNLTITKNSNTTAPITRNILHSILLLQE